MKNSIKINGVLQFISIFCMKAAKVAGEQIGRRQGAEVVTKKSLEKKEIILKHSKDFNGSLNDVEVMVLTGLARNTHYKYKRELKAERSEDGIREKA